MLSLHNWPEFLVTNIHNSETALTDHIVVTSKVGFTDKKTKV